LGVENCHVRFRSVFSSYQVMVQVYYLQYKVSQVISAATRFALKTTLKL